MGRIECVFDDADLRRKSDAPDTSVTLGHCECPGVLSDAVKRSRMGPGLPEMCWASGRGLRWQACQVQMVEGHVLSTK